MNFIKLTLDLANEPIRINVAHIIDYMENDDKGTDITTTEEHYDVNHPSIKVKESPEQIDRMLLDMGVKICP